MERGTMPMSKNKKILLMLAKGGATQSDIAAALHVSKRDVSAGAKVMRECGLTFDAVSSMDADAIDGMFFAKEERRPNDAYLRPDMEALVERKKMSRKLPVKLFWLEYCERAAAEGKLAYAYQTFCEMFADAAARSAAVAALSGTHMRGTPPNSSNACVWPSCQDFCLMSQKPSAQNLSEKGSVTTRTYTLVLVPSSLSVRWATSPAQSMKHLAPGSWEKCLVAPILPAAPRVTLVNREYERFAEHYGAAVVPARVRRPRDKSVAESCVDLVERWIIGPSGEMTFYTIDEFNEFCAEKVAWLNSRPFSAKDGSRDSVFDEEERMHLMPLPAERYEMCEWRSAKVAPDYHVTVDYMHYSVDHSLIGEQVDVKLTSSAVTVMHGGEVAAAHPRLHGRKGQYSTNVEHMPENHAALDDPWSPERFASWAMRIGPETASAIDRVLASRAIVEQSFVSCRNILGLSKTYAPALLERACAKLNAASALPSYTGLKNAILAIKSSDAEARAKGRPVEAVGSADLVDRAKSAGRLRGADAYKRGGE